MLYVGLMSGTSMDGIDAVLLEVDEHGMRVRAATSRQWPDALRARLRAAAEAPAQVGLFELGSLDAAAALEFAAATRGLLGAARLTAADIRAVGSHGQTLLHQPRAVPPFTLQIGDPSLMAEQLGIDVVADFRRRDLAAGGEGAPLAPAFHQAAFGSTEEVRAVLNLGGIANLTILDPERPVLGFDTGPGNCLMDAWVRRNFGQPYDPHGAWAAAGRHDAALLAALLDEPYFARPAPKSTGRDLFSDEWLAARLATTTLPAGDVQATLSELTAQSITGALLRLPTRPARLLVCGGGIHNTFLLNRLAELLPFLAVQSTADYGIAPEHVEGAAFAWLAHRHVAGATANLPSVTGARHAVPLGGLFPGKAAVTE
ncbi:MAG TPA: anhydro-N-acetylmuramic acid kinase [Steroidobacteraceae bacterium]|nr:anhydro-N-acetylmuramic acid kinase [Steroidobacteraceae bacterium]